MVFPEIEWDDIRRLRNRKLSQTDIWALTDRTMTAEQIEYRRALRDIPQDYDTHEEAREALNSLVMPEGA